MDEDKIREVAESGLRITIRDMLREISRSKTPFRFEKDQQWDRLEQDLFDAAFAQFGMNVCLKIDWEHHALLDPSVADQVLSKETLVPYLRCNFYCAEYLDSHRKQF